eukprot:1137949-Pelagomonas_calceolata.AAC.1
MFLGWIVYMTEQQAHTISCTQKESYNAASIITPTSIKEKERLRVEPPHIFFTKREKNRGKQGSGGLLALLVAVPLLHTKVDWPIRKPGPSIHVKLVVIKIGMLRAPMQAERMHKLTSTHDVKLGNVVVRIGKMWALVQATSRRAAGQLLEKGAGKIQIQWSPCVVQHHRRKMHPLE